MKKALIITYYWPPGGGNGVQRWVKFVKYIREFGWEPVVFTVDNGEYPVIDNSLLKDIPSGVKVIKSKIWEPFSIYKKLTGKGAGTKINRDVVGANREQSFKEHLAIWMRGNLFIPDARKYWIKPSVKYLISYLKENPVDVIISTGPPHSTHMIALEVKRKTNVKWVADFRDPWTTMDFYKDLKLTGYADNKHHRLEKEVLKEADKVISVGRMLKKEFDEKRGSITEVITNGYDEADFPAENISLSKEFTLVHVGSFLERRNPFSLWKALSQLTEENSQLKEHLIIRLIGRIEPTILKSIQDYKLDPYLEKISYLDHNKIVAEMKQAQVLLLPIDDFEGAKWVLTGKLFEYLAARRPILCIGPTDGDAAAIIKETNTGVIFNFDDVDGIKKQILFMFESYLQNKLNITSASVEKYSRRRLTQRLVEILNSIPA